MATAKEKKDQELIDKVQGTDKPESFKEASEQLAKDFAESNKVSSKSMSEKITGKLKETAGDYLKSLKDLSRPGGLIKSVGLMVGSPGIMLLGNVLNDTLDEAKSDSTERKQKQEALLDSLKDQGYTSEEISEILAMNGKSNEDIANTLKNIEGNTEPDFTAEELADEQIARDEKQLSFLEKMVESLNGFKDKLAGLSEGTGLMDFLALAGLTAAVILAPFSLITGFFVGLVESIKWVFKMIMVPINAIKKLFSLKGLDIIDDIVADVPKKASRIAKFFGRIGEFFTRIKVAFQASDGIFAKIIKGAFGVGRFLGKMMFFVQVITSIFDTVTGAMEGFKEEGIIGAIKGGIKGLLNGLVFSLLDMVKDGISWLADYFGFENIKTVLDSFSFVEMFTSLVDKIFSSFGLVISFLKDLFTFPDTFGEGLEKLVDIINLPLNLAINWVKGLFNWGDQEEPFKLSTLVTDTVESIWAFIEDLLDIDWKAMASKFNPLNFFKDEEEAIQEIEPAKTKKKKAWWDFSKDEKQSEPILTKEFEPKQPLLLSAHGGRAIQSVEREQQMTRSGTSKSDNTNNIVTDNSIINNISTQDMSIDSPDTSLGY